jgi:hypothetical protein
MDWGGNRCLAAFRKLRIASLLRLTDMSIYAVNRRSGDNSLLSKSHCRDALPA